MPRRLTDEEQTRHRLEILNQFFRGMLLLNGGGCIALLAFLQAIWSAGTTSSNFVRGILGGMALFIAGLAVTVAGQYLRYETSKAVQFEKWYAKHLQIAYFWLVILSVLSFLAGAIWVVVAVWDFADQLPP